MSRGGRRREAWRGLRLAGPSPAAERRLLAALGQSRPSWAPDLALAAAALVIVALAWATAAAPPPPASAEAALGMRGARPVELAAVAEIQPARRDLLRRAVAREDARLARRLVALPLPGGGA